MIIETGYLILAVLISIIVGIVLYKWQKPVLTMPYIVASVIGTVFAVYYILHVMLGSGRTGWP